MFEYVIPSGFSLHLLQNQVISRCDLVMLVVLNEYRGLIIKIRVGNGQKLVIPYLGGRVTHVSHHGYKSLLDDRD